MKHLARKKSQSYVLVFELCFLFPLLIQCTAKNIYIKNIATSKIESSVKFLAVKKNQSEFLFEYQNYRWRKILTFHDIEIIQILPLDSIRLAIISRKNGIQVIRANDLTVQNEQKDSAEVSSDNAGDRAISAEIEFTIAINNLADDRIRGGFFDEETNKLYITYYTPNGSGITACELYLDSQETKIDLPPNINGGKDPRSEREIQAENQHTNPPVNTKSLPKFKCLTMNKLNSELRSNYVHEIYKDFSGNIWFRYAAFEGKGVSRLNKDNGWSHFSKFNSELGDSDVKMMRIEKPGTGLEGDNIWFVTSAGLSRLQYKENKEHWKFYGVKNNLGNSMAKFIGIESWFTDAILNITDLIIIEDSLLIANKNAIFHFTGDNINKFTPEDVGGLSKNVILHIYYNQKNIHAGIYALNKANPYLVSQSMFNMQNRKWTKINLYGLKKENPDSVTIVSLTENKLLLIFNYVYSNPVFTVFDTDTKELKQIPTPKL